MTAPYTVSRRTRLVRSLLSGAARVIFHILARVEIEGRDNIPRSGPYLIAFNHVSIFDPPFMIAFWPVQPEILGAVDIWSRPGQDLLARLYEGIPIRRGEVDRDALERTLAALRAGLPLMLAPEGGRSHHPGLRQAKPGVVYILERTGVPVVPVGVVGTTDDFFARGIRGARPLLRMKIGKQFSLPQIEDPLA
ncbi:MAG TPA: lysophospholipid acyltransferase family protein, partial [Anaerolineaceae bacterium]